MNKQIQRACVLGLGASGSAAARLLRREGVDVVVVDQADSPELQQRGRVLQQDGVDVRLGMERLDVDPGEQIVVSPGIAPDASLFSEAERTGVPMISELELGWSRRTCPVLAITGSNGKSTAVKMAAHLLNRSGMTAVMCGNYGPPICDEVQKPADWLVMEVSSFQLETVRELRPDIAICLNVLPNHLDRHGSMEAYGRLKARLFAATRSGDLCLVDREWIDRMRAWSGGDGDWISVGIGGDLWFEDGWVVEGGNRVADLRGTPFDSPVTGPAMAAVLKAVNKCGVPYTQAAQEVTRFEPLPHRMQVVANLDGIRFVNDSKATNLAALAAAVAQTHGPVRLLAGGVPKERDFSGVKDLLVERVSAVYLMGQSSEAMASTWASGVPCLCCETMERAFQTAVSQAQAGDTVLLSPGCTSFDQFRDYRERGDRFMELVDRLDTCVASGGGHE